MDNFTFYSPTKFVFGKDTESNAGALIKEFGGSKVLLHFGGKSAEKSGLLGRVRVSLKGAGLDFVELGGVHPNPLDELVYEGIDFGGPYRSKPWCSLNLGYAETLRCR